MASSLAPLISACAHTSGPRNVHRVAASCSQNQILTSSRSGYVSLTKFSLNRTRLGSSSWLASSPSFQSSAVSHSPALNTHHRLVVYARRGGDDTIDATQRVIASAGYFLPFLDGVRYGRYLYLQYPFFRTLLDPIVPLVQLYNGVPFAGFIAFFVVYLAVIQNPSMSRYVRFNCMQAVILDILMILPSLFERVFNFRDGVGLQLTVIFYNTVFLYLLACFLFGVGSCLLGKSPRLPLVGDAADAQVPF